MLWSLAAESRLRAAKGINSRLPSKRNTAVTKNQLLSEKLDRFLLHFCYTCFFIIGLLVGRNHNPPPCTNYYQHYLVNSFWR